MSNSTRRLYRSRNNRMFGGVCAGIGEFFGIDPTIVRLTFVLVTLVWPFTPLVYIILLLVLPEGASSEASDVHSIGNETTVVNEDQEAENE